jgi:trehalose synthase
MKHHKIVQVEDYKQFVGARTVDRIRKKARTLQDLYIVNVNSTYYGGGVSELLSSMTLLMNSLGIDTGWRTVHGPPDFFSITKKMHNALQGGKINLSARKMQIYEDVVYENAIRNHLDNDVVIIHNPQALPLIDHYRKKGPWIWRCYVDLSSPDHKLWNYLTKFIEKYDAVIISIKEYAQKIRTPQIVFMPAIDPFSIINRKMSEEDIKERLAHYNIPTDLPLVVQISRFDRWKDPEGVIKEFKLARQEVEATLVLLATDDPEGADVYNSLLCEQEDRIRILSHQDGALVNALQNRALVVLQKPLREGFGLTVSEAMWKNTPVIGGNVGGIRYQIENEVNDFLVSSV